MRPAFRASRPTETLGSAAGFKVDLVKRTDHQPSDDLRPPSHRDLGRRCRGLFASDGPGRGGDARAAQGAPRELVNPKIAEHRGRIVKNTGDGFLAEFASVVDAVRCAVEIQRGMAEREPEVPEERRIRFRIGINLGDVIAEDQDIFGDGVNVAARLEALAEPGGICISRVVRDQVRDRLDYTFEDMGEQQCQEHRPASARVPGSRRRRSCRAAVRRPRLRHCHFPTSHLWPYCPSRT